MMEEIERLLCTDNKSEFAFFLRKHIERSGSCTPFFTSSDLLKLICLHRAVGCASVLLKGETGLNVDLKVTLEGGLSPLHLAAQSLSYDLTKIFLQHGARAKLHSNNDPVMFPLTVALKALCNNKYVSDWTPKKSIYKLLYIFCLPELNEPLGTIKLLASKTCKKQAESICSYCIKEGEVVQLMALLFGAWDKLLAPSLCDRMDSCPVWQYITREEGKLEYEISLETGHNGVCKSRLPNSLRRRKTNLNLARQVLTIMWRAFDIIENYRDSKRPSSVPSYEVSLDVAYLLFNRGHFHLKPEDVISNDVECLRPKLGLKEAAKLKEDIEKQVRVGADLYTPIAWSPKHEVPYDVLSKLSVEGLHLKQKNLHSNDAKCSLPQLEFKDEGEPSSFVSPVTSDEAKHVHSKSTLCTFSGERAIGAVDVPLLSSAHFSCRSLHTYRGLHVNSVNTTSLHAYRGLCVNSVNTTYHQVVMKQSLPKFLVAVKICARLISTAKRCL